ncbi:MAG: hypothetical protein HUJ83_03295 [Veillonella sp.]|uniref:type III toxin-antitoxin system TenpIN family toxin n=1 Tax=Veillonella caviae TaxID=248316 RepID=UPI000F8CDE34|nr:hypothetical protein [Veillonella caviae]MCF0157522.1 hypothetical protein [Veillonella sp.]
MKFIYLTKSFYNTYPKSSYPEIENKMERPYAQIVISINHQLWALPLRSNIKHKFVQWTDKINNCGIDLTKAVPISESNQTVPATIRQEEFNALKGKEYILKSKFISYIKLYKKAKLDLTKNHNKQLVEYSTLQYFEEYI